MRKTLLALVLVLILTVAPALAQSANAPVKLSNTPCAVMLTGAMQAGTCTGSFTASVVATSTPVPATATNTPIPPTSTSIPATDTSVPALTSTPIPTDTPGTVASACGLTAPAFCDDFSEGPAGTGNRSGDLDGTVWGVSRESGNVNLGSPLDGWEDSGDATCGQALTADHDIAVCNGQAIDGVHDGGTVTTLAMYPKQPFDIAGRTGIVSFDVSNNTLGNHAAWPEFWYTDQPLPAPFTHEQSYQSTPRNGVGVRFAADCAVGQGANCAPGPGCRDNTQPVFTVDSFDVVRDYESFDSFIGTQGTATLTPLDCVTESPGPTSLNRIQLHISQHEIDIYASNAGTTTPLVKIAAITNATLTLTRGLIWIEDAHYNGNKFNGQGADTFTWDNVGFDGPILPRDLTFDVPDCLCGTNTLQNGDTGYNLGWAVPSDGTMLHLTTLPMTAANLAAASGALLTFNYYSYDPVTLSYSLNGNAWQQIPWPYPDQTTFSWRSLAVPIPLADLTAGANTIQFQSSGGADIANVDIILMASGGVVAPR